MHYWPGPNKSFIQEILGLVYFSRQERTASSVRVVQDHQLLVSVSHFLHVRIGRDAQYESGFSLAHLHVETSFVIFRVGPGLGVYRGDLHLTVGLQNTSLTIFSNVKRFPPPPLSLRVEASSWPDISLQNPQRPCLARLVLERNSSGINGELLNSYNYIIENR